MTGHVRVNGAWKEIASAHCKVSGSWKEITAGYANKNGTWEQIYSSYNPALGTYLDLRSAYVYRYEVRDESDDEGSWYSSSVILKGHKILKDPATAGVPDCLNRTINLNTNTYMNFTGIALTLETLRVSLMSSDSYPSKGTKCRTYIGFYNEEDWYDEGNDVTPGTEAIISGADVIFEFTLPSPTFT